MVHDKLDALMASKMNAEGGLFNSISNIKTPPEGKRLFKDRVNISDAANMHEVE